MNGSPTPDTNQIRCENCAAFHPSNPEMGLCRRHAPQLTHLVVMVKSVAAAGQVPQIQHFTSWPVVKNGEGCLEFAPESSPIALQ